MSARINYFTENVTTSCSLHFFNCNLNLSGESEAMDETDGGQKPFLFRRVEC